MIKNLIFDFGKVLVDYRFDRLLSSIVEDPEERKEFYEIFCSDEFCDKCDKEDVPFQETVDEYKRRYPKWERQIQEFHDRHNEAITGEVPGMRSLMEALKAGGYGVYGLSNWSSTVYAVMDRYEIFRTLDGRVISSEEHMIKPYPEIYRRLCEKYSLRAEECLFVDDKQVNIDGALAVGMDALLFNGAEQLENDLRAKGILSV